MSIVRQATALPGLSCTPPVHLRTWDTMGRQPCFMAGWESNPQKHASNPICQQLPFQSHHSEQQKSEIFPLWSQSRYKSEADRFSTSQNVGQRQPSTRHAHQFSSWPHRRSSKDSALVEESKLTTQRANTSSITYVTCWEKDGGWGVHGWNVLDGISRQRFLLCSLIEWPSDPLFFLKHICTTLWRHHMSNSLIIPSVSQISAGLTLAFLTHHSAWRPNEMSHVPRQFQLIFSHNTGSISHTCGAF